MSFIPPQNRRRIHLVDHVLQKWLLGTLVIMEMAAVSIAIWVLYRVLGEIVDENMYRIHFSGSVDMLALMVSEGLRVLSGILLVNLLALIIADRVWAFYVDGILRHLARLISASNELDFSGQGPVSFHHAVLEQALSWREAEAAHLAKLRDRIRQLPAQLPMLPEDRNAMALTLAKLQDD